MLRVVAEEVLVVSYQSVSVAQTMHSIFAHSAPGGCFLTAYSGASALLPEFRHAVRGIHNAMDMMGDLQVSPPPISGGSP